MVITMAKLRMAHASTHGARKPPGPKEEEERLNDGDNNGQATHGARKHALRTQAAWAKTKTLDSTAQMHRKSATMHKMRRKFTLIGKPSRLNSP